MADTITISGQQQDFAIRYPSGLFAVGVGSNNLDAYLVSLNATFGFNVTPHQFDMEFVPDGPVGTFHGASGELPPIGHMFELDVGDFSLRGDVRHADYTVTPNGGTIVNVRVEDYRKSLRKIKLHTEDLGEDIPSGVVSVARAYRINNGLTTVDGDPSDPLIREYERILDQGATYSQIINAITLEFNAGNCAFPAGDFPSVEKIEANIGGTVESIRWKSNLQPMDEMMTRILQDAAYDWYWYMDTDTVALINKKHDFDITESDMLDLVSEVGSTSGLNETTQIGFGTDFLSEPTRFRLLGGHQQGFINSELLSPIDGLETFGLDGNINFAKAWDQLAVGFYDARGFYRTYTPIEKELQLALAGIEQWTYYKIFQTASVSADPPGYGAEADAGSIAAQDPTFQSRLDPLMPLAGEATSAGTSGIRFITNRRDSENNWVIAFYNRLRDHAARHYGRSYVAEGLLFNEASGLYRLIDSAWANVENQIEGTPPSQSGATGPFVEDYEINQDLGPVSPFLTDDYRVKAHCVMPSSTVYGPQGDDVPASFGNWTEDAAPFNPTGDGKHYIPVDLAIVGQRVKNPRSDTLYSFETYPEGTIWCQLPINAGSSSGLIEDSTIANLVTLLSTRNKLSASGLRDILNPAIVLNSYNNLSGVVIPVESRKRYGQGFPTTWVTGSQNFENDESVQLDDQFVPWSFSPAGSQTSLDIMTERAMRRVIGKIATVSSSRYADFNQVGLPLLTFDGFSNQNLGPDGLYGEVSHGISELNITFGTESFKTHYKVESYFSRFGKEAPRGERVRGLLNGIINPVDFTSLLLTAPSLNIPSDPFLPGDSYQPPFFHDDEERAVRVTINEVNNSFALWDSGSAGTERYRGEDQNLYIHPPQPLTGGHIDFTEGAVCVDGFLNITDEALYHTDSFNLSSSAVVYRYFTGGRPFGNGTVVTVNQVNPTNSDNYDVTILDPTASGNGVARSIKNVPVLHGAVNADDRTTLAVQGDAVVRPGTSVEGLFLNPSVIQGVIPVQVTSVSDIGTSGATATAQALWIDGVLNDAGTIYSDVVPLPIASFCNVGDRGFLSKITVEGISVNFLDISKPPLFRFE